MTLVEFVVIKTSEGHFCGAMRKTDFDRMNASEPEVAYSPSEGETYEVFMWPESELDGTDEAFERWKAHAKALCLPEG